MKRFLGLLPVLAITTLFSVGSPTNFDPVVMRPLCLGLAAVLALDLLLLRRHGPLSLVQLVLSAYVGLWAYALGLMPPLASLLKAYASPLLYLMLLLMASLPQLLGREPFTTFFAKRTAPQAVWQTDIFRVINLHMSWAWAGLFLACLVINLLPGVNPTAARLGTLAMVLLLGLPFNKYYPAHYQRKLGITPVQATPPAPPPSEEAAAVPSPSNANPTSSLEKNMSPSPTVVALNGSPHAGMGNTAQMIEMLRPGLEAQGLALEVIDLAGKDIGYCQGCAFCLEKGACWINDDHRGIMQRLLDADAVILASPVYFFHVTAQMKTFLDRCLAWGHKPRGSWKPGLAISVAASVGEVDTAEYLGGVLRAFGAFSVGRLTALATNPSGFLGKEEVQARAADLAVDLARAVKEKRRYPATGNDLIFYLFMKDLIEATKDTVMKHDYKHWEERGLLKSFEAYVGQQQSQTPYDPEMRQEWIKGMIAARKAGQDSATAQRPAPEATQETPAHGPQAAQTCRQLLQMMPLGFNAQAAQGFSAIYQFEVRGSEEFTAHLVIADGACRYVEGPAEKPDVVIKTPADVWLAISQGRQDGQAAFMGGKYQVEGNLMLLLRLKDLFSG
jgi:multimeric flavodoxin WrbA/putative sterol carrier protein